MKPTPPQSDLYIFIYPPSSNTNTGGRPHEKRLRGTRLDDRHRRGRLDGACPINQSHIIPLSRLFVRYNKINHLSSTVSPPVYPPPPTHTTTTTPIRQSHHLYIHTHHPTTPVRLHRLVGPPFRPCSPPVYPLPHPTKNNHPQFDFVTEVRVERPDLLMAEMGVSRLERHTTARALLVGDGMALVCWTAALSTDWGRGYDRLLREVVASLAGGPKAGEAGKA